MKQDREISVYNALSFIRAPCMIMSEELFTELPGSDYITQTLTPTYLTFLLFVRLSICTCDSTPVDVRH